MNFSEEFTCSQYVFTAICTDDGAALFDAVSSDKFPSALPLAKIATLDEARQWCSDRSSDWNDGTCFVWTCRCQNDLATIGQVTLFPQENYLALAYWVTPKYWGKGLAVEICRSLISQISCSGYRGNIWAGVHSWNKRSEAILRKLGFTKLTNAKESGTYEYSLAIVS